MLSGSDTIYEIVLKLFQSIESLSHVVIIMYPFDADLKTSCFCVTPLTAEQNMQLVPNSHFVLLENILISRAV